jgi:hypothetical protein
MGKRASDTVVAKSVANTASVLPAAISVSTNCDPYYPKGCLKTNTAAPKVAEKASSDPDAIDGNPDVESREPSSSTSTSSFSSSLEQKSNSLYPSDSVLSDAPRTRIYETPADDPKLTITYGDLAYIYLFFLGLVTFLFFAFYTLYKLRRSLINHLAAH